MVWFWQARIIPLFEHKRTIQARNRGILQTRFLNKPRYSSVQGKAFERWDYSMYYCTILRLKETRGISIHRQYSYNASKCSAAANLHNSIPETWRTGRRTSRTNHRSRRFLVRVTFGARTVSGYRTTHHHPSLVNFIFPQRKHTATNKTRMLLVHERIRGLDSLHIQQVAQSFRPPTVWILCARPSRFVISSTSQH